MYLFILLFILWRELELVFTTSGRVTLSPWVYISSHNVFILLFFFSLERAGIFFYDFRQSDTMSMGFDCLHVLDVAVSPMLYVGCTFCTIVSVCLNCNTSTLLNYSIVLSLNSRDY